MKAYLDIWSVEEQGPAFNTRREEPDGSVSYEAISRVSLRFTVIGNDARDFLKTIMELKPGAVLTGLNIAQEGYSHAKRDFEKSERKYVFD